MKILQICSKAPYPPLDGGRIAMNNLTHGLIEAGCEVKILAMSTPRHPVSVDELPEDYVKKTNIEVAFVDTSIKIPDAAINVLTFKSYNIRRFYSISFEKKLVEILKKNSYDVVQLETLYTTPYIKAIRNNSGAKIVLRTQNIEYKIWKGLSMQEKNPFRKWYLRLLAGRLKVYEIKTFNLVDAIAAITREDAAEAKQLGCIKPITVAPFGIDLKKYYAAKKDIELNSIFHLGSMDWRPNEEAIEWFLNNVWSKLHEKHPDLKFYLAGRNMPSWILKLNLKNVVVEEDIKNSIDFMASKNIMIVPLLSGGGMRVKIIEGMAMGKTVISTTVGAKGINYKSNQNILVADSPMSFVNAVDQCLSDPTFCKIIGENSKNLVKQHYNNLQICTDLVNFYKQPNSSSGIASF